MKPDTIEKKEVKITLTGKALELVTKEQADYLQEHKRYLSIPRAILSLMLKAKSVF